MKQSPLSAYPISTQPKSVTGEECHPAIGGFWQQPFVQNVLPFVTSLSVHAGILIFGLLVFGAVKLVNAPKMIPEVIIPVTEMQDGPLGAPLNVSLSNSLHESISNLDERTANVVWTPTKGPSPDPGPAGPAGMDAIGASVFDVGDIKGFRGGGSGGGAEGLGLIGDVGSAYGPKGAVFGCGGNVRRIVYLCDATGSMINKFATLKDELNKSIVSLKPIQAFDIVFFQGVTIQTMGPSLVLATPEHKRKAGSYLEGVSAMDTTNPIPSMEFALKLKPQLLYFLTDAADFPDPIALLDAIKKNNPHNETKINTILFVENKAEHEKNADSEGLMKRIASDSGGTFRWVEMDSLP